MSNPHVRTDGTRRSHVPITTVLNPHVRRPAVNDPARDEYDAALRIVLHLCMIFSGIIAVTVLSVIGASWPVTVVAQGLIPGAIQEIGDFKLHL